MSKESHTRHEARAVYGVTRDQDGYNTSMTVFRYLLAVRSPVVGEGDFAAVNVGGKWFIPADEVLTEIFQQEWDTQFPAV